MAKSLGSGFAAAQGLESGFRLALGVQQGQREQERQDALLARQSRLDTQSDETLRLERARQQRTDQASAISLGRASLQRQGQSLAAAGGTVNPTTAANLSAQADALNNAETGLVNGALGSAGVSIDPKKYQQFGAEGVNKLKANDIPGLAPGQFTAAVNVATQRPTSDFMRGPNGEPSKIDAALGAIAHSQDRNSPEALQGANFLYGPDLNKGLGEQSPQGGIILGKEIVHLADDPRAPAGDPRVVPVVRVWVGKGTDNAPQIPGAPQGATHYYDAPLTRDRSSNPDDPARSISLNKATENMDLHFQLADLLNSDQGRAQLQKDAQQAPFDQNAFFAKLGVQKPQGTTEYHALGAGGTIATDTSPSGKRTERVIAPTQKGTAIDQFKAYIDKGREDGSISSEDADELIKKANEAAARGGGNARVGLSKESSAEQAERLFQEGKFPTLAAARAFVSPSKAANAAAGAPTGGAGGIAVKHGAAGLSKEQNEALFGENGAVTTGKLDPNRINSKTAALLADAFILNPKTDMAKLSGDIALGRNATYRQRAMVAETLPEIMTNMVESGKKLGFSDIKTLGKMQAWVKGETNDPQYTEYMTQRNDALMTIASVMRGVGMTDQAHRAEIEVSAPTMSPRALDAWYAGQMKSLEPRLKLNRAILNKGESNTPAKDASAENGSPKTPTQIKDAAGYSALPSGAEYLDPNGVKRRKP